MSRRKPRIAATLTDADAASQPRRRHGSIAGWFRTDRGMACLLNRFVGRGRWTYDSASDRWLYLDSSYAGPGQRCFVVISRDLRWHVETVPGEAIQ